VGGALGRGATGRATRDGPAGLPTRATRKDAEKHDYGSHNRDTLAGVELLRAADCGVSLAYTNWRRGQLEGQHTTGQLVYLHYESDARGRREAWRP
jgi:hypothetical protein